MRYRAFCDSQKRLVVLLQAREQGIALLDRHAAGQAAPYASFSQVVTASLGLTRNATQRLGARGGHEWLEQVRGNANSLEQVVNHERELVGLCLVLGKRPRLGVFDVVVRGMNKFHGNIFARTIVERIHRGGITIDQAVSDFRERIVERIGAGRLRRSATVEVLRAD